MGSNPGNFKGSKDLPVETVSWEDAQAFLTKLNGSVNPPPGMKWSLPTEAQWEYACRAGTESVFAFGDTLTSRQANFNGDVPYGVSTKGPYLVKMCEVGLYQPNAWGLHDMHGNVTELCLDALPNQLRGGVDPVGSIENNASFRRGGYVYEKEYRCRSGSRYQRTKDERDSTAVSVWRSCLGSDHGSM